MADPSNTTDHFSSLPVLDLSWADEPAKKTVLLDQLRHVLFNVGFLYIIIHGVPASVIHELTSKLPTLFSLPEEQKLVLSKINSPHFLGYSAFAEETTLGRHDLREQFDLATELPPVDASSIQCRHPEKPYWRLRGPNVWPPEDLVPGFRDAFTHYHDAVQALSYRFVHLIEEAFSIPVGTFDDFFVNASSSGSRACMPPQHRIKLVRYPPSTSEVRGQGVGPHKDSSGWLTLLLQVGKEEGLEVVNAAGDWIPVPPLENSFVINFGNAFEAATEGAVKATVHRVVAPKSTSEPRYSIPFFQGLPLDMTVSEVRSHIPEAIRKLRSEHQISNANGIVSSFLDPRWDSLGESQLRKWIRSHQDVGRKWYGDEVTQYYLQ